MGEHENIPQENGINLPLEKDAVPVCPNCLEPCNPLDYYCPHCGSNEALNPLASYMPFVDIRFRAGMIGKLWRIMWDRNTFFAARILYFLLFILFMPIIFLIASPFVIYDKLTNRSENPVH